MRRAWCWTRARDHNVLVTVWAVAVVRDEADIIEATVTRMLRQVDHVLVADNQSVDGTDEVWAAPDGRRLGDVLDGLPDSIFLARARTVHHVITDRDPDGPDAPARM